MINQSNLRKIGNEFIFLFDWLKTNDSLYTHQKVLYFKLNVLYKIPNSEIKYPILRIIVITF